LNDVISVANTALVTQRYSAALANTNAMTQDTIHLLFPGLKKLLNFQRKFLIRLEETAELPWAEQRWGKHFLDTVRLYIHVVLLHSLNSYTRSSGGAIRCL